MVAAVAAFTALSAATDLPEIFRQSAMVMGASIGTDGSIILGAIHFVPLLPPQYDPSNVPPNASVADCTLLANKVSYLCPGNLQYVPMQAGMGQMPRLASDFVQMQGYSLPHDFVAPNGFVLPPGLTMPAGATVPFADPVVMPNLSTTPGVVEVNLDARLAPVNINGAVANLMTYNGQYPTPTIKVRRGDTR